MLTVPLASDPNAKVPLLMTVLLALFGLLLGSAIVTLAPDAAGGVSVLIAKVLN